MIATCRSIPPLEPMAPLGPPAGNVRAASPSGTSPPLNSARSSHRGAVRQRAPGTMLDIRPKSARLPGYTGHQPGIVSESLLGKSYAYITGFRKDLLSADHEEWLSEYHRNHSEYGGLPIPKESSVSLEAVSCPEYIPLFSLKIDRRHNKQW